MVKDAKTTNTKAAHESFAAFFERPTHRALAELLLRNFGEFSHIDFKKEWTLNSKLARHVLGMANSNGGVIVFGVTENPDKTIENIGLESLKDKSEVIGSIRKFIPDDLPLIVLDFAYTENDHAALKGKRFQVVLVDDLPERIPFVASSDGDGIKEGHIYYRHGTNTQPATHNQLQEILGRRLAASPATYRERDLRSHLDELKLLYDSIRKTKGSWLSAQQAMFDLNESFAIPNPFFPEEGYDQFIARAIEAKKTVILDFLRGRT